MIFSDWVSGLRGEDTLEEFAARAGLSFSQVAKMENGKLPKKETLLLLARKLKLSEAKTAEGLLAWVNGILGNESRFIRVELRNSPKASSETRTIADEIVTTLQMLPEKQQRDILIAVKQPEGLKVINEIANIVRRAERGGAQ